MTDPLLQPPAARLQAALHWRIEPPFASVADDWLDRAALAGCLAGSQLAKACAQRSVAPQAVFLLSTLLDPRFTTSTQAVRRFVAAFEAASGHRLNGIANAYLCAGWGFVLRHLLRNTALDRVALCIVDLDLHDMEWQREHPVIGRSGFGMSSLLFELPADRAALPECGGPFANSAFTEFVFALRAHRLQHGVAPTFLPFTQPALHGTAQRVLANEALAPNRYDTWGHCFGSDPWIGLIEWLADAGRPTLTRALTGAIGFNGYYTMSDIEVEPALPTEFRCLDGAWPAPPGSFQTCCSFPSTGRPPAVTLGQPFGAFPAC